MKTMVHIIFAGILSLSAAVALAQGYPSRPIQIVVPYPAGGGTDVLTRLVGKHMAESFKQPVMVENRPGGNAQIGMDLVRRAAPDGYTLLAIATGPLNADNEKAFAPIALFAAPAYVLVVNPSIKANTVQELVSLVKAQPGKLAYGSSGAGAASHLAAELFKSMSGTDILHVPYKGVASAVNDLLGGHVQLMFAPPQAVASHIRSGALRALGVTGGGRMPLLPELPTISESGVAGYEAVGWFGLLTRANVAPEIVNKLNAEVNRVLQLPEMRERLRELGGESVQTTPAEFLDFVRKDNAKWAKLIKEKGIVIE